MRQDFHCHLVLTKVERQMEGVSVWYAGKDRLFLLLFPAAMFVYVLSVCHIKTTVLCVEHKFPVLFAFIFRVWNNGTLGGGGGGG